MLDNFIENFFETNKYIFFETAHYIIRQREFALLNIINECFFINYKVQYTELKRFDMIYDEFLIKTKEAN